MTAHAFDAAVPRGIARPRGGKAKVVASGPRSVARSSELSRVAALPRRDLSVYDAAFAAALSREIRRDGSAFELRVKQAPMLVEAVEAGGLLGGVDVGEGKSVLAPLFGKVLDVAPVVLLVPPQMRAELLGRVIPWLKREIDFVPPIVVSYSELSTARGTDLLERLAPRAIVCDEVHNLKSKASARTKRVVRYLQKHPETILVGLSGTLLRRSIRDFWHLVQHTHKGWRCPVTRQWREAQDWAAALDPQVLPGERLRPGALLDLCRPGEDPRDGFFRRLAETDGVVFGGKEDVGASLVFSVSTPPVAPAVERALAALRAKWELPSGEQIVDALDFARRARELAQGFYYVWDWPRGVADEEWLEARAEWRSAVAAMTKLSRPGLDSELLVRNAVARDDARLPKGKAAEALRKAWRAWEPVRGRAEPETRAVWIDDSLPRLAVEWARGRDEAGGIVWLESRAFRERVEELLGGREPRMRVYGPGERASRALVDLAAAGTGPEVVFLSTDSHGTGKNLQRWSRCLVTLPWPSGADWTQHVARLHRPGQLADEVAVDVWAHTEELRAAIDSAREQSEFLERTSRQKMLQGTWVKA